MMLDTKRPVSHKKETASLSVGVQDKFIIYKHSKNKLISHLDVKKKQLSMFNKLQLFVRWFSRSQRKTLVAKQ